MKTTNKQKFVQGLDDEWYFSFSTKYTNIVLKKRKMLLYKQCMLTSACDGKKLPTQTAWRDNLAQ